MPRKILGGLLVLVAAFVVIAAAALLFRAWRQNENARALSIATINGIEEMGFVQLGGIDQWVQIRGQDRNNPVLLFLHGGPGVSETPMSSLFRPWEKYFTVVMWDQRCAGKTFAENGPKSCAGMSIASVAHEGIELADYLRHRLHKNKVIALGHSWGTMIGVRMVKARPDLFCAYVGTGQVVSIAEKEPVLYARTMARLRAAHARDGIRALEKVGAPPYKSPNDLLVERAWSQRYDIPSERDLRSSMTPLVLFAPGWSLWDIYEYLQAEKYAEAATYAADASYDARDLGPKFEVPFFIFNGDRDNVTPSDLARPYFDSVQAPVKQFVLLKGAGHSAVLTKPDLFLSELVAHIRPVCRSSGGP